MKIYHFESEILVNASCDEVFQFFSNAENLEQITPDSLRFKILTPLPITMAEGIHIDYRIKLYGIPLRWETEITVWDPPNRFIDSQLRGPYKSWIHEHTFKDIDGKCLISDKVSYQLKGGILTPLINRWFVQKNLTKIFNFRRTRILTLFSFENPKN